MDWLLVAQALWFYFPAAMANLVPGAVKRLPILNSPLDFGKKWRGREIFGSHKTWRGVAFGVGVAVIVALVQTQFETVWPQLFVIDMTPASAAALGFTLGLGALAGDALKSLLKRRLKIRPGGAWPPFDQIDWIVGAIIAGSLLIPIPIVLSLIALVTYGLLHPITNVISYSLGFKEVWW